MPCEALSKEISSSLLLLRTRIAQSSVLPPVADEPTSPLGDDSQGEAFLTNFGFEAEQDRANIAKTSTLPSDSTPRVTSFAADEGTQELEINRLKTKIKLLEDKDRGVAKQSGDDAPIKGRRLNEGEEAAKRVGDDTKEMATVLTSMDAASILTSGGVQVVPTAAEVSTATLSIPTGSGVVSTASPTIPTAALIFTTATESTTYTRRKGKETMVESETPKKKKKVQEQIDVQLARELEEEMDRDTQRTNEQIARDAEIARIHAEEELLSKEIPSQGSTKKNFMSVLKSHGGWKARHFKGMTLEEIKEKFDPDSSKKLKTSEEVPEEKLKEMMELIPVEELWALLKETLSIRPAINDKEMELWVELKRLDEFPLPKQLLTAYEDKFPPLIQNDATVKKIALLLKTGVESKINRIEYLTNELEMLKKEKGDLDSKLTGFQTDSKDLDNLLESQRSDKNKEGLGYSTVPPPPDQVYSLPKKDMSWLGLPEFADDTITDYSRSSPAIESNSDDLQNKNPFVTETGASSSTILSKPAINFVKAAERPTKSKTDKDQTTKKPAVKYAELYRKTSKRQVNTVRPKAVINRRNCVNDVKASACWVWKPVKPNSASIILKIYDYIDVRGRSSKYKTAQELWAAILKTFGGNEATKKIKKNLLKQQYGNFKAEGSKTLEQTFNRLQAIVSHLQFMDIEIEQDDLNQKFLTSLAPKWLMHTVVWRNRSDLDTMSLDDLYNHLKVYEFEVQKKSKSNSQNMAFISSAKNSNGKEDVNTASIPTACTNVSPASVNIGAKKAGKKISIQGTDVVGFDKLKVECFNCHKMGHFARECRAPRSQDMGRRDNYRQGSKVEEQAPKVLMAIDRVGWDWSIMKNEEEDYALVADEEALTKFTLMAKTSAKSMVFDNSLCSKNYKKNTKSRNSKITNLTDKLCDSKNMLFHYKLALSQVEGRLVEFKNQEIKFCEKIRVLEFKVESKTDRIEYLTNELEMLKKEKGDLDNKLTGFQTASKDLNNLLESQRSDKNKEGLGYSTVPPPPAQVYSPPKKDMSWIGLHEFVDDTITDIVDRHLL
nr:hypothetical protein [Tanacetum cinerariifolium]